MGGSRPAVEVHRETAHLLEDFLRLLTPAKHESYVTGLWQRAQRKIGQWMQGQLLLSLISGTITYLGLLILGVPYALLLAVIAAVMNPVPVVKNTSSP